MCLSLCVCLSVFVCRSKYINECMCFCLSASVGTDRSRLRGREAQIEDVLPPIKIEGPTSHYCHICSTSEIY